MKNLRYLAAIVAAFLTISALAPAARAQQAAPAGVRAPAGTRPAAARVAPAGSGVAILDLSYIFKEHNRFKAMTAEMRGTVQTAEKALKDERESLIQLNKSLNGEDQQYKRGTPEYKQLEAEVAQRQADLQAKVALKKKEFLEREAKIYYNIYREIMDEVKAYSDARGISLVMRFNGDPVDPTEPQTIIKELNKSVVYYNEAIDITPVILNAVNGRRNVVIPKNNLK